MLRVQLKPDGTLANVALEQPSGVEFLDDEAIEAFKQAQPFPNPPLQLVDQGADQLPFRLPVRAVGRAPHAAVPLQRLMARRRARGRLDLGHGPSARTLLGGVA